MEDENGDRLLFGRGQPQSGRVAVPKKKAALPVMVVARPGWHGGNGSSLNVGRNMAPTLLKICPSFLNGLNLLLIETCGVQKAF